MAQTSTTCALNSYIRLYAVFITSVLMLKAMFSGA